MQGRHVWLLSSTVGLLSASAFGSLHSFATHVKTGSLKSLRTNTLVCWQNWNIEKILSGGSLGSYVDEGRSKMREIVWIAGHIEHRYSERKLQSKACLSSTPVWGSLLNQSNRCVWINDCVRANVHDLKATVEQNVSALATLDFNRSVVLRLSALACSLFDLRSDENTRWI